MNFQFKNILNEKKMKQNVYNICSKPSCSKHVVKPSKPAMRMVNFRFTNNFPKMIHFDILRAYKFQ